MRYGRSDQSTTQICRRITFCTASNDRVAENGAGRAADSASRFVTATFFNFAKSVQQFRSLDLSYRAIAELGNRKIKQPFLLFKCRRRVAFGPPFVEKFFGHGCESVTA